MPTRKYAFAYTRSLLMDKLEEHLAIALHHRYLLSLLDLYGFTHYLLDHWTDEYQMRLAKIGAALAHPAKISRPAKLRALAEIKTRLLEQDTRHRRSAHRHFVAVFRRNIGLDDVATRWLTSVDATATLDDFWYTVQTIADGSV